MPIFVVELDASRVNHPHRVPPHCSRIGIGSQRHSFHVKHEWWVARVKFRIDRNRSWRVRALREVGTFVARTVFALLGATHGRSRSAHRYLSRNLHAKKLPSNLRAKKHSPSQSDLRPGCGGRFTSNTARQVLLTASGVDFPQRHLRQQRIEPCGSASQNLLHARYRPCNSPR